MQEARRVFAPKRTFVSDTSAVDTRALSGGLTQVSEPPTSSHSSAADQQCLSAKAHV